MISLLRVPALLASVGAASLAAGVFIALLAPAPVIGATPEGLAAPSSFAGIADQATRSAALFTELGRVLTSPRCVNCHPAGDRPHQGDAARLHQPPVFRGEDGMGLAALRCTVCHQATNNDLARIPGHDPWFLAPREMAFEGRTVAQLCAQLKDPKTNGGRTLADLVHHIGDDGLVGWGWAPGVGRTPVPGTQQEAKALAQAWVDTGAACPKD
ncbi:Isoquinoline 1-oxidoreductase subunit [Ancylobacter sp.]|uniref:Isoquinoline 1-oxidoreductase subunit n=1 Tax=Ancylobacter sp. TaxID=1872567 RepID=UPI003D139A33